MGIVYRMVVSIVSQIVSAVCTGVIILMEDFRIGFERLWIYAGWDAGKWERDSGKNHGGSQAAVWAGMRIRRNLWQIENKRILQGC